MTAASAVSNYLKRKSLISRLRKKRKNGEYSWAMKPDMRQILLISLKTFVETAFENINDNTLKKSFKNRLNPINKIS